MHQCAKTPRKEVSLPVPPQKNTEISPLFKVNPNVVLNVGWVRDGKLNVGFSGWDASKVVLDDQVL
jgi:hypothetical protein